MTDEHERGDTGAPGEPGATGATGASGNPGATGASGASGATGAKGAPGTPGGAAGPAGPAGRTGATGPAGPAGPAAPTPPEEPIPLGYRHIASFLKDHPSIRRPSSVTIVVFMVLVFGGGFLHFSDAAATRKVEKAHNASACTFRVFLAGLESRALRAAADPTATASARARSRQSLPQYKTLLDGQVTTPRNLDCTALLRKLAADNRTHAK